MSSFQLIRMNGVMRVMPTLPTAMYTTFGLYQPSHSHFRKATCKEVQCKHYELGWITRVVRGSKEEHLARTSGRNFQEVNEGNIIAFHFHSEQPCFKARAHELPLEREAIHVVRGGDFRGNPLGTKTVHTKPEFWREEFAEHQDKLNTAINRG